MEEVKENVSIWTKKIVLGPDETSWRLHRPKATSAHIRVNHNETEHVKYNLDYAKLVDVKHKHLHRSFKTTPPPKILEQEILYTWSLLMFCEFIPNRYCITKNGYHAISKLTTKLANRSTPNM